MPTAILRTNYIFISTVTYSIGLVIAILMAIERDDDPEDPGWVIEIWWDKDVSSLARKNI